MLESFRDRNAASEKQHKVWWTSLQLEINKYLQKSEFQNF